MAIAIKALGINKVLLTGNKIILTGDEIRREIPVDEEGLTWLKYYGDSSVYEKYLLLRVIKSQIRIDEGTPPYYSNELFKDKIVMIASDSADLKDLRPNPFNKINDPGSHYFGTAIDNIMRGEFVRNFYEPKFVIPFLFIFSIITALATTKSNAYMGLFFTVILILLKTILSVYVFRYHDTLTDISVTNINIAVTFALVSIVNYVMESQQRAFILGAFGQYLSPEVVDQLVKNPSKLKLGGERKIMTAFFSDVQGFSGISEKLDPEELVALLNEYLSEMCDIIGKNHGTVDKFEGDAIIAFWGAPIEMDVHAYLACKSSLEMKNRMIHMRSNWRKQGKHELFMRIGLNSGTMIVGNMGSRTRMDYTMMGDSVNLASRLEGANKLYGTDIIISEHTFEFVKGEFEVRELDLVRVVGKNEPVRIYELMAIKEDLNENEKKGVVFFRDALSLYREKKFKDAIDVFQQVFRYIPEDMPAKTYIKRCEDLIENEPDTFKGYYFIVLDEPDKVNAFAVPGGFIFITTGLIFKASNEDELAGILAHEVAHIVLMHPTDSIRKVYKDKLKKDILSFAADQIVSDEEKSEHLQLLVSGLNELSGMLIDNAAKGYSREKENEADAEAIEIMINAGYNPAALSKVLEKLNPVGSGKSGTHGNPVKRSRHVMDVISEIESIPVLADERVERFSKVMASVN